MRPNRSRLAPAAALAVTALVAACSSAGGEDVGASGTALSGNNVTRISTISYAPNSFVIGNAYPGWTDVLHGREVWGQGPGNEKGAEYRCGFLYGESFDHCGWLGGNTVQGSSDGASCGGDCPSGVDDEGLFRPVYTNGNICSRVNKTPSVCNTFMNYLAPTCKDRNAYGNVGPWQERSTPDNLVEQVPHRAYLQWRYVAHDGRWVMVMDPSKNGVSQPNWYFVSAGCVDVSAADTAQPPPLPSAEEPSSGKSAPPEDPTTGGTTDPSSSPSASSTPPASASPSGSTSSTTSSPAPATHCCAKCKNREDAYHADSEGEACGKAADTFCSINGRGGVQDWFEGDCPEAP